MNPTDVRAAARHAAAQGLWDRAARAFEALVTHDPLDGQAWMGLGTARLELKQYRRALECLSRARELVPEDPYVMANLASVLRILGDLTEAARLARLAAQHLPDEPLVLLNRHLIEQALGDLDAARKGYEEIVRRWPALSVAHHHLGQVLMVQDQLERSAQILRQCLAINHRNDAARKLLVAVLLRQKQHQDALTLIEGALRLRPDESDDLALRCIALRHAGRATEAAVLDDARDWLKTCRLEKAPEGWDSVPAFNADILRHVLQHPDLGEHGGQATLHGRRVEDVLAAPQGPVHELAQWILEQLQTYLHGMHDRPHPLGRVIDGDFALRGWAVLMHEGGHETPHVHPGGVLSCVYYPALPEIVSNAQERAGNLCFGEPDPIFVLEEGPPPFSVAPQEGELLIFPSWLWHHTVPFFSERPRLSLAFDLYPQPRKASS